MEESSIGTFTVLAFMQSDSYISSRKYDKLDTSARSVIKSMTNKSGISIFRRAYALRGQREINILAGKLKSLSIDGLECARWVPELLCGSQAANAASTAHHTTPRQPRWCLRKWCALQRSPVLRAHDAESQPHIKKPSNPNIAAGDCARLTLCSLIPHCTRLHQNR
jgi:hypothetical protein